MTYLTIDELKKFTDLISEISSKIEAEELKELDGLAGPHLAQDGAIHFMYSRAARQKMKHEIIVRAANQQIEFEEELDHD